MDFEYLKEAPFNMEVKTEDPYTIVSYNMIKSDFKLPEVQLNRGRIYRDDITVCYAFDKFFNYGEPYAATIHWDSAVIQEKIDGSLMKVWFDQNQWHLSTNNTINADNASTSINGMSFGDVFRSILQNYNFTFESFTALLDPLYTYMFEMVSPFNLLVVQYNESALYFLGRRNIRTFKEDVNFPNKPDFIKVPRTFKFGKLADVIAAAALLDKDQEGFVVRDKYFNRIKIKGQTYLELAHLKGNNAPSTGRLVELFQSNLLDDYEGNFTQYVDIVEDFKTKINQMLRQLDAVIPVVKANSTKERKEIAAILQAYPPYCRVFGFLVLDNKETNSLKFLMKLLPSTLERYIRSL